MVSCLNMHLLLSNEEESYFTLRLFDCAITSILSVSLLLILFRTEAYLSFGNREIIPLFLLLILFETVKWCFHRIIDSKKSDTLLKKRTTFNSLLSSVNYTDAPKCMLVIFSSCIGYYVIAVMFGAQILDNQEETLMFSILLTTLTVLPISIQCGSNSAIKFIQRLSADNRFYAQLYRNAYCALSGAWLGAIVIPLDWDRPWQVWPIPCSFGAVLGYSISNCIHLLLMIISLFLSKEKIM